MIHPCITIPVRPSCSKRQPGYCEERLVSEPASPLSNDVGPKLTLGLSSFHCKLRIGTLQRLNGNVFANTKWKSLPQLLHKSKPIKFKRGVPRILGTPTSKFSRLSPGDLILVWMHGLLIIYFRFYPFTFLWFNFLNSKLVPQLFIKPTFINYFHTPGSVLGLKKTMSS